MKASRVALSIAAISLIVTAGAAADSPRDSDGWRQPANTLQAKVRTATARFQDVQAAEAAGYTRLLGCVSGPDGGAMGVHYLNASLVGDGAVDASMPEALIYEPRPDGRLQLVGAEFIVFAEPWHAGHAEPPVLAGHVFDYTGEPNRYAAPAHYDLHVWAWRQNPNGAFADWNPRVSCDAQPAD